MNKVKTPKEKKPNYHRQLLNKFVNIEFCCDKYFWGRETKILNNLIKKYSLEFLLWVQPPENYKVTSLTYFLTGQGKNYLSSQLVEYTKQTTNLTPTPSPILEVNKIGEDIIIPHKPKTLRDFINMAENHSFDTIYG